MKRKLILAVVLATSLGATASAGWRENHAARVEARQERRAERQHGRQEHPGPLMTLATGTASTVANTLHSTGQSVSNLGAMLRPATCANGNCGR